jgi:Sec-independent protein translocase protein TatA
MEDAELIKNMMESNGKIIKRMQELINENAELQEDLKFQKNQEKVRAQNANKVYNQKVEESKEETELWRSRYLNLDRERSEKIFAMERESRKIAI